MFWNNFHVFLASSHVFCNVCLQYASSYIFHRINKFSGIKTCFSPNRQATWPSPSSYTLLSGGQPPTLLKVNLRPPIVVHPPLPIHLRWCFKGSRVRKEKRYRRGGEEGSGGGRGYERQERGYEKQKRGEGSMTYSVA